MARRGRPRRDAASVPGDEDPAGWDPIAQGKARFAGIVPITNGSGGSRVLMYTSMNELVAVVVTQMMQQVLVRIGRGDVSDKAAKRRGITGPDGPRWPIAYPYAGESHWYLPDFIAQGYPGAFRGGVNATAAVPTARYVIEAGPIRKKASAKELAKLTTARDIVRQTGGEVIVVSTDAIPMRWLRGSLALHLYAFDYRGKADLRATIRSDWERTPSSIRAVIARLGREEPPALVAAAAWAAAGDLAREGRLAKPDLADTVLGLDTRIAAHPRGGKIVLPPGLITDLDELVARAEQMGGPTDAVYEDVVEAPRLRGSIIDPDAIVDAAERDEFRRRLAAAKAHEEEGISLAAAARRFGLPETRFQQMYRRSAENGEAAFYAHASYSRAWTQLPEEMVALIRRLYSATKRPTITEIVEDRRVHQLSEELHLVRTPSWRQVKNVVDHLETTEHAVRQSRAGSKSTPLVSRGRSVDVESRPGFLVELDESKFDAKAVAIDGTEVAVNVYMGALICVGTRDILSVVLSPKPLDQWDLRRLLLRAMLPKDELKRKFGFRNDWPTSPIPVIVSTDNGKIMSGNLAMQAAEAVPFVLQLVPVRDPHAKPFIESFNASSKALFEHRLIVTTGSSPQDRGRHEPEREAGRRQITPDKLERALIQQIPDVYRVRWHRGLRERPGPYWEAMVERLGTRTWQGTPDELRRALKRDEGLRLVTGKGVSYLGRWYGADALKSMHRKHVRIKVDDDDLRTIDVYTAAGLFLGAMLCDELATRGRPVSRWELGLEAEVAKSLAAAANVAALRNAHAIQAELEGDEKANARRVGRRRHQRQRADETATQASTEAASAPRSKPTPLPSSLPPAVAADDSVYVSLDDVEEVSHAA